MMNFAAWIWKKTIYLATIRAKVDESRHDGSLANSLPALGTFRFTVHLIREENSRCRTLSLKL